MLSHIQVPHIEEYGNQSISFSSKYFISTQYVSSLSLSLSLSRDRSAFTLVELMIVIAIIGILAAALFPSLTSYLTRGKDTSRLTQAQKIVVGNESLRTDIWRYANPSSESGCGGWDTPIDGVFLTELSNYMKFNNPDGNKAAEGNCGWIQYFRYPPIVGVCPIERWNYYVLVVQRNNSTSVWENSGFSCTGRDWQTGEQRPWLATPIVYWQFEQ
jgi:prepilin-type N-terminal cleavage/methylation domain-containing protein